MSTIKILTYESISLGLLEKHMADLYDAAMTFRGLAVGESTKPGNGSAGIAAGLLLDASKMSAYADMLQKWVELRRRKDNLPSIEKAK
jgi:hypothetical protein